MNCSKAVKTVLSVRRWPVVALAMPKSITLGQPGAPGFANSDKNIRGFDVAMDDALLMRVLDGLANLREKFQPVFCGQIVLVAVIGDLDATHQFHDEVRAASLRGTGIEDLGNARMVHECQGLALGFETGNY